MNYEVKQMMICKRKKKEKKIVCECGCIIIERDIKKIKYSGPKCFFLVTYCLLPLE